MELTPALASLSLDDVARTRGRGRVPATPSTRPRDVFTPFAPPHIRAHMYQNSLNPPGTCVWKTPVGSYFLATSLILPNSTPP